MAGRMELVDKDVETTIMSLLYMFKVEHNKDMMKWQAKIQKRSSEIYGDEKYII